MLLSQGQSKGKVYHLPGAAPVSPEQVFAFLESSGSSEPSFGSNAGSSGSSEDSFGSNGVNPADGGNDSTDAGLGPASRDENGCLISPLLDAPVVDALSELTPLLRSELLQRATLPRKKARLDRDSMISVILAVCDGRYVRLSVLAELLSRNVDGLRKGYLDTLVKDNRILRAFPGTPTHEMQSYRTAEVGSKGSHRS